MKRFLRQAVGYYSNTAPYQRTKDKQYGNIKIFRFFHIADCRGIPFSSIVFKDFKGIINDITILQQKIPHAHDIHF